MGYVFELMGRHSLSIFVLIPSNVAIIIIQGFYWKQPNNNIVSLLLFTLFYLQNDFILVYHDHLLNCPLVPIFTQKPNLI
jgi:hypothetical protein